MDLQLLLRFPAALRRVRAQRGMAQKVVALTLGLDQAQYCGVEKGRRPPFNDEAILRLSNVLGLNGPDLDELKWAARHDRCLRIICDAAIPLEDADIVSSALSASRQLDTPQRSGLRNYLSSLEVSAGQIRALVHGTRALTHEEPTR
jgi:transcriptional regulator with XRE-family HTH domain